MPIERARARRTTQHTNQQGARHDTVLPLEPRHLSPSSLLLLRFSSVSFIRSPSDGGIGPAPIPTAPTSAESHRGIRQRGSFMVMPRSRRYDGLASVIRSGAAPGVDKLVSIDESRRELPPPPLPSRCTAIRIQSVSLSKPTNPLERRGCAQAPHWPSPDGNLARAHPPPAPAESDPLCVTPTPEGAMPAGISWAAVALGKSTQQDALNKTHSPDSWFWWR